jgi:Spy/CpxP family protein refolding chaperone
MKIRVAANGLALGLAALLALAGTVPAQQDTAQAAPHVRGRGHGMGMGMGMMMRGGGMGGFMRADHVGPPLLLGLKDELGLSEEQVSRLEKIHEDHRALMKGQMEKLREHRETVGKARAERDWKALEKAIDESAELRAGLAKGILNVERQSLGVLTDAQREKFETWQEGARLLREQRMKHMRHMRGQGMRGRGMGEQGMQRHRRGARPESQ